MEIKSGDRYWNPVLETLPREQLKEMQFKKFKRILEWGYSKSKMYRRIYDAAGFEPGDVKSWDDIFNVPTLQKEDYRSAQAKDPWPYGDSLCVPLEKVTEYHQTSGTTGQPVYQPDTGRTGNGGARAGPISFGRKVSAIRIEFLSLLVIIFLLLTGPVIMPVKKLVVRWFPAVFSTLRNGCSRFRN